jgi:hypothetical protein
MLGGCGWIGKGQEGGGKIGVGRTEGFTRHRRDEEEAEEWLKLKHVALQTGHFPWRKGHCLVLIVEPDNGRPR